MSNTDKGKPCSKCSTQKALSEFHLSAKAKDGRASWCKCCVNTIARASRKRNYDPADKRRWQLQTRYGITPADVEKLFEVQGGRCALCEKALAKFHVDHDHNTGRVRGLLCHKCNIRLGGWDDLAWRTKALGYLGLSVVGAA